jgi:PKD repeat protein
MKFHSISDTVILTHKNNWRINTFNLHADFSYATNGLQTDFTNQSANYDSVQWSFGDGNFSSQLNPVHTYSNPGTYIVVQYAYRGSCTDSSFHTIQLIPATIENNNFSKSGLTVFPNPSYQFVTIESNGNIGNIQVFDTKGNVVISKNIKGSKTILNIESLYPGVYFIQTNIVKSTKLIKMEN